MIPTQRNGVLKLDAYHVWTHHLRLQYDNSMRDAGIAFTRLNDQVRKTRECVMRRFAVDTTMQNTRQNTLIWYMYKFSSLGSTALIKLGSPDKLYQRNF